MTLNYKSYQQVLNLAGDKRRPRAKKLEDQIHKRTKTGCLTCRRRKKKCDEDLEDGKCQSCIRNFLDCCWSHSEKPVEPQSPVSECESAKTSSDSKCKNDSNASTGASAYPSPVSSPQSRPLEIKKTVKVLRLLDFPTKIAKPSTRLQIRFVNTSFDKGNAMVQIK